MAVAYSADSAYAKDMARWESQHTQYGPPGRPYTFVDYPVHLSKAVRPIGGGPVSFQVLEAGDEQEERNLASRGFVRGRDTALIALEQSEMALAEASANRAFNDRLMTEKALREAERAESLTAAHLGEIPEQPRRGRPRKVEAPDGV